MKGTNIGCLFEEASISITESIEIGIKNSLILNLFRKKKQKKFIMFNECLNI